MKLKLVSQACRLSMACFALIFFSHTSIAEEEETNPVIALGLGGVYAPEFSGAEDYEMRAFPVVYIEYDRFTFGGINGLSYDIFQDDTINAGVSLGYFRGRDESDALYLQGLGDLESSANLGIYAKKTFGPFSISANIKRDFSEDVGGITGVLLAGFFQKLTPRLGLSTNLYVRWINDDYAQAVFGVSEWQALSSHLPITKSDAGVESGTLSLTALYAINSRWSLTSSVSATRFIGDAKASPITRDAQPMMAMTSLSYQF